MKSMKQNYLNQECPHKVAFGDKKLKKVVFLDCGSWSCPVCQRKNVYRLRKHIQNSIADFGIVRMLTLTVTNLCLTSAEHYACLQESWRQLTTRIKNSMKLSKSSRKVRFFRVNELHESGYYHIHVLIDQFLPQKAIYDMWNRILRRVLPSYVLAARGEGSQLGSVNLRMIGSSDCKKKAASDYISKLKASLYVLKNLQGELDNIDLVDTETGEIVKFFKKARHYSKSNSIKPIKSYNKKKKEENKGRYICQFQGVEFDKFILNLSLYRLTSRWKE